MASIIRVKRSTGTIAPATLNYGELGLTIGVGTHGNSGGRLFVGDNSSNPLVVGGRYYTDILSIGPGLVAGQSNPTTPSNGFVAILDSNRKVNQWNVDNITIDANAITSTNVDGHITITPNGTGRVQFLDDDELQFGDSDDIRISYDTVKDALFLERGTAGTTADIRIADDVHFQFGTDNDARIYYDETSTDRIQVEGASWTYASSVAQVLINASTVSTASTNGALVVTGGVGIGGTVNIAGDLAVEGGDVTSNTATLNLFNTNVTTANVLGAGTAVNLGANSGTLTVGNPTVVGTQATQNLYNTVATNLNFAGAATALVVGATTGITTIRNATVDLDGDLNVDGGDITTNLTAFNLLNATATNINAFGAATALVVGATTGITTIRNATVDLDGDLNVDGGDITTNLTAFNLLNATATNVNAFGAATALVIGATSGIATINNPTVVGTQATQNLYNTVATNLNFAGAATALVIGATTGIATIRNETLSVPNATTLNLGSTSSSTSVTFPSTPNTSFVSIAATTNATTTTSGALRVAGGVGIVSDVYIGGTLNLTGSQFGTNLTLTGNLQVDGNTTLGNASGDVVTITGSINHTGPLTNTGGVTIDNIGISSNVISTRSGGGNVLYIDPYPDGLSNEGLVVVKGNLQVDGTTTTVDSNSVTVNGAIISLGDVTSNRTVVSAVASGVSTITLDSVVGINTGDIISGNAALPNSGLTTITAYNTSTKIVTITGTTSSGITSTTQLTITHAYDTNTDRGISFDYNTGVGLANQKSGFFGFDDSTGYFTYIPDASISNSVVTGTKGTLDIGALYLNFTTSGISTRGSAYFDTNGKLISTNSPEVGTASTSNLILTTNASNVPVWTDTLDGGTF